MRKRRAYKKQLEDVLCQENTYYARDYDLSEHLLWTHRNIPGEIWRQKRLAGKNPEEGRREAKRDFTSGKFGIALRYLGGACMKGEETFFLICSL